MEKRKLGTSGIEVSVVGVGCNNFGRRIHDVAAARAVVDRALDLGVTLFDTADVYGNGTSEEFLGEALGARRQEVVHRHQVRLPMSSPSRRASRRIHHADRRGEPEAAAHRLDRPLPGALSRSERRRSRKRCARSTIWSARARCARSAARTFRPPGDRRAGRRAAIGARGLRHLPGRIQPAGARHRARPRPADARARHDAPALLAARQRPPDRQVPAQRAAAEGRAARLQQPPRRRRHQRAQLGRWSSSCDELSHRAPATACSNSRSAGCWRSR